MSCQLLAAYETILNGQHMGVMMHSDIKRGI